MTEAEMVAPGLWLMFALGLRHGFDPDHIAMIDGMAYHSVAGRPRLAPWIGTLFALGHGLTVTVVAVALGALAGSLTLPEALQGVLDWMPTVLLLLVGTLNLRELLSRRPYRMRGWKTGLMPRRLAGSTHPLAIVAIGILFALVFDTATQAAAWGYAATARSGSGTALAAGLAFTAGMVLTDTVDGRVMTHLLRRASSGAQAYRRRLGAAVVVLSYAMAAYQIGVHLHAGEEGGDLVMSSIGVALFLAAAIACCLIRRRTAVGPQLTQEQS
jgi:high-affinity nickel-transport protein